jgi:antitoxin (DNA-binding transcriptional repressor) of toxin-antitoxin stability system
MKSLDLADAFAWLAKFAEDPNQEPVILTVSGKPVAVVLPTGGADVETISLSLNPKFLAIMERSRKRYEQEGGITSEEIRRRFGLPPSQDKNAKPKKPKLTTPRKKLDVRKRNRKEDGSQV